MGERNVTAPVLESHGELQVARRTSIERVHLAHAGDAFEHERDVGLSRRRLRPSTPPVRWSPLRSRQLACSRGPEANHFSKPCLTSSHGTPATPLRASAARASILVPVFDGDPRRRLEAIEQPGGEVLSLVLRELHGLSEQFRGGVHAHRLARGELGREPERSFATVSRNERSRATKILENSVKWWTRRESNPSTARREPSRAVARCRESSREWGIGRDGWRRFATCDCETSELARGVHRWPRWAPRDSRARWRHRGGAGRIGRSRAPAWIRSGRGAGGRLRRRAAPARPIARFVRGSGFESENIEQGPADLGPARILQSSDERPQVHAVHDTDPLWLQNARAREAVGRSERDLPRKTSRSRREGNDRDLRERRQHISAAENEHRPSLVRCREAKPADVAALDHGNSGSPSSVSGPSSALWSHASHARRSAAVSGSSTASTTTRTRWPSRSGTGASSSMTLP